MHKRGMDFPGGSHGKAGDPGLVPLQYSCLENSMNKGTWQATVHDWAANTHTHIWDVYLLGVYECAVGMGKEIRKIDIEDTCI